MSEVSCSRVYDEWGRAFDAPFSARLGGMVIACYLKAVYATSTKIFLQTDFHEKVIKASGKRYIWAFWHRHVGLAPFFSSSAGRRTCMASRSRDGELSAQVMCRLGVHCARGSSSLSDGTDKGGGGAFRQMARAAKKNGHQLVITPDGPKGPHGRVRMGVVSLASVTGYQICPVACAASRFFTIPTWDGTIFPLPFGRISAFCGEPLDVPRTRDKRVLEAKRVELEKRLIHVNNEAKSCLEKSAEV